MWSPLLLAALVSAAHPKGQKNDYLFFSNNQGTTSLIRYSNPYSATIQGYDSARCLAIEDHKAVCSARRKGEGGCELVLRQQDRTQRVTAASCFLGEVGFFEVLKGDLDRDGSDELLVLNHDGESNGLGVNYWTISIFRMPLDGAPPTTFSVEDFGDQNFRRTAEGELGILETNWMFQNHSGMKSNYFLGRWFTYENGQLVHDTNEPIRMRRLTNRFEQKRSTDLSWAIENAPFSLPSMLWLTSQGSSSAFTEPFYSQIAKKRMQQCQILAVERIESQDGSTLSIDVKSERGIVQKLRTGNTYREPYGDSSESIITRFGDLRSGRLYPANYQPTDVHDWMEGKKAQLVQYYDETGWRVANILYIDDTRKDMTNNEFNTH